MLARFQNGGSGPGSPVEPFDLPSGAVDADPIVRAKRRRGPPATFRIRAGGDAAALVYPRPPVLPGVNRLFSAPETGRVWSCVDLSEQKSVNGHFTHMTRLTLFLLGFLLATTTLIDEVHASDETKNEIYVGWGPQVLLRKDQVKSPRLYSGPALLSFEAGYRRTNDADAHRLSLGYAQGTVRSQPDFTYYSWPDGEERTTEGDPLTQVRLRYAYLRRFSLSDKLDLAVGPGLDVDVQHGVYVISPYAVDGYYGVFALDARAELAYRPSQKHRLVFDMALPLFAWVARSPYSLNDDKQIMANLEHNGMKTFFRYIGRGKFRTWNQLQAVRLSARYDYRLSQRVSLSAGAQARILSLTEPRPLLAHDYGANLAATFHF